MTVFMRERKLEQGRKGVVCFGDGEEQAYAKGKREETEMLSADVTRETMKCMLCIERAFGKEGGIALLGAGDGCRREKRKWAGRDKQTSKATEEGEEGDTGTDLPGQGMSDTSERAHGEFERGVEAEDEDGSYYYYYY